MIPIKYGVGYTRLLDQGVALRGRMRADGSVMLQHGGAEMGQGIDTKMMQIAAETLGIDMSMIRRCRRRPGSCRTPSPRVHQPGPIRTEARSSLRPRT